MWPSTVIALLFQIKNLNKLSGWGEEESTQVGRRGKRRKWRGRGIDWGRGAEQVSLRVFSAPMRVCSQDPVWVLSLPHLVHLTYNDIWQARRQKFYNSLKHQRGIFILYFILISVYYAISL